MSEEMKSQESCTPEEYEEMIESAIDAFEEKVQNNDYLEDIEAFYQLLEKANRWDTLPIILKRIN